MIVNVVLRPGASGVLEQVDGGVLFEGGAAEEGVLATFQLDGREATGRVVRVLPADPDADTVVEIELIDKEHHDRESEITLANLPPRDDTNTKV
jgi:hypothetical protein